MESEKSIDALDTLIEINNDRIEGFEISLLHVLATNATQ
jgi:hypothetical protein